MSDHTDLIHQGDGQQSVPVETFNSLTAAFGARMEVGLQIRAEMSMGELARYRAVTKRQVVGCQACKLRTGCKAPVPMTSPTTTGPAKVLVIGEAPGKREDELGRPFVGPAGRLMRAMMQSAGWDLDEVAWCNTVSCLSSGAPGVIERKACRGNLRDQVAGSGATYVILAGSTACDAWRGDLKVSDVHGGVFLWGGLWVVMPVYHPAAILRDMTLKSRTIGDLTRFQLIAGEVMGDSWMDALGEKCVKCGDTVVHYDPDAVPYCQRHWLKHGGEWKRERERWENSKKERVRKNKLQQEAML